MKYLPGQYLFTRLGQAMQKASTDPTHPLYMDDGQFPKAEDFCESEMGPSGMATFAAMEHGDLHAAVYKFSSAAGDSIDKLDVRQAARYTGMQCEELAEKLEAIGGDTSFVGQLYAMGMAFKRGDHDDLLANANHKDLLDADVDLMWVSCGAANSLGANTREAIQRVGDANYAKVLPNGTVVRDANGKITKPEGWKACDLTDCLP